MKNGSMTKLLLEEVLDLKLLNAYIHQIYSFTHIPITILDKDGETLVASQWSCLCKEFMRTNKKTEDVCRKVCAKIGEYGDKIFTCPNGLCMYSVPILIKGEVVAYLVLSQFLTEKPNMEFFHARADYAGMNTPEFFRVLSEVPLVSQDKIQGNIDFLNNLVVLLHDMIERRMKAKELEEELMQNFEELEASYQDVSSLNDKLYLMNVELQEKNELITKKENRYRALVEKMKQGTLIIKRTKKEATQVYIYEVEEVNPAFEKIVNHFELIDFILENLDDCLANKSKCLFRGEKVIYEIECESLSESDVMVCLTDISGVYEKLLYRRKQIWDLVSAMGKLVEKRDLYTADHQKKVAILAVRMAIEMELGELQVESVFVASMLHDIGKISIPAEILTKPDKLTAIEYELMKTHVINAQDILKRIQFMEPITEIVMQHHERLDGSGYPGGLVGDEQRMEARIVAVADVYEAITAHRPYRPSLGHEFAVNQLEEGSGKIYDARVVEACKIIALKEPWEIEDVEKYLKKSNVEMIRVSLGL